MNDYPNYIKQNLSSIIDVMAKNTAPFVKNPEKDFSRNRKLPFDKVIHLLISLGGNSIYRGLLESQGYNLDTVTASAFIQQRDKILPHAFEFLLNSFTNSFLVTKKYRNYRLLAVDGSALRIARNPNHPDTYFKNQAGGKGFNMLHLNVLYDLCNKIYVDALVQPRRRMNENVALIEMINRSSITDNTILTADRGFECFNNFAHIIEKGWNYLIRVKDINSNGILSAFPLPSTDEFDISIQRTLTRKHDNKEIDDHPDIYKVLPSRAKFDLFDDNGFYPISFRIVRFKITDDSYETVITNLNQSDFPPDELREIYNIRWKILSAVFCYAHLFVRWVGNSNNEIKRCA